jgi:hypothetical protein
VESGEREVRSGGESARLPTPAGSERMINSSNVKANGLEGKTFGLEGKTFGVRSQGF